MEKHESSKTSQHSSQHSEESESKSQGLGLGLGVNIELRLGELRNAVDMLTDALKQTGETATGLLTDAYRKIREAGFENLKGSSQGGQQGETRETYDRLVSNLREAANRGEDEARNMLQSLGENVESAGKKMEHAGSHDEENLH